MTGILHLRDGAALQAVLPFTARNSPAHRDAQSESRRSHDALAVAYRQRIIDALHPARSLSR